MKIIHKIVLAVTLITMVIAASCAEQEQQTVEVKPTETKFLGIAGFLEGEYISVYAVRDPKTNQWAYVANKSSEEEYMKQRSVKLTEEDKRKIMANKTSLEILCPQISGKGSSNK